MKKHLLLISALFFTVLSFSQGIEFEQGTWKEVLEKAKQTNKPIFVDIFTSWCGPCKMMSKNIFPLAEVGKVYNENFVCYQIDAEKGEGIEIAKKYEVKAYPTYLFIKSDETLFSRALGSMEADKFIAVSKTALADMNDPKPIEVWEKEYSVKKNDPVFLLDYMNKRSKLGKSNTLLFDEYLKLLPEEDRTSDTVLELYKKEERNLTVNSFAYINLQNNKDKFIGKLFGIFYGYLTDGIMNSLKEAAKSKNEQLLHAAILAHDQLPKSPLLITKDELYMDYYKRTDESAQYLKYATNFCNNVLMNISTDSIEQRDHVNLQRIEQQINSGALAKLDSSRLAELKEYMKHVERNRVSQSLNNIAWEVFKTESDKTVLQDALRWSKRSLEIYPNNPMWLDTYANLLYKSGQNAEAIAREEEALKNAEPADKKGLEKTLAKMKAGEKTWKENKTKK